MEKTITAESLTEDGESDTDGESMDSLEKMGQESASEKPESLLKIVNLK